MEYVKVGRSMLRFSGREFRRQLHSLANGGEFDVSKGRLVALEAFDIGDYVGEDEVTALREKIIARELEI